MSGRTDDRNRFALVASVHLEIDAIDCDDAVARMELTEADEAEIGEVGLALGVPRGRVRLSPTRPVA